MVYFYAWWMLGFVSEAQWTFQYKMLTKYTLIRLMRIWQAELIKVVMEIFDRPSGKEYWKNITTATCNVGGIYLYGF